MTGPHEAPDPFSHRDAARSMMFERHMILSEMGFSHHRGSSLRNRETLRFLRLSEALLNVCRAIAVTPEDGTP